MIKIRVKGHDLLSERTNVPLLASAQRSQGPSKTHLPSPRRGAERLDPRRRAAHVDSTSQIFARKMGGDTHHGHVKDLERLRLDGTEQAVEEDGVKKSAQDLSSVLAVEYLL